MSDQEKKEKLLEFLDKKAFDPIIRASGDKYPEDKKKKLQHVKKSTESEKKRYHEDYATASDIKVNYLRDLDSRAAKKIDAELDELNLPILPQFKQDFMDLCDRLGV